MGPDPRQSAFVVTELHGGVDEYEVVACCRRQWLTLEECELEGLRHDHLRLLMRLDRQANAGPESVAKRRRMRWS